MPVEFKLCGRGSRLAALEAEADGLRARGFTVEKSRHEEVNHCWRAAKPVGPGATAMAGELDTLCRAADRSGGIFTMWSANARGSIIVATGRSVEVRPLMP